jgi:copper transport protein
VRDAAGPDVTLTAFQTLIRSVEYLTLFAGAGGALFLAMVLHEERRLVARLQPGLLLLAGVAGSAAILDVGLHGAALAAEPAGLLTGRAWLAGLASPRGLTSSVIVAGMGFVALAVAARGAVAAMLASVAGAALSALALAFGSEASLDDPAWLSFAMVLLHGLASLTLVGAVWPLLVTLTTQPAETCVRILRTGRPVLATALAVVLATGILLSPLGISDPDAVTGTSYGLLWLAKVLLSAILVALLARQAYHRTSLLRRVDDSPRSMRGRVLIDGLVLAALVVVSVVMEVTQGSNPYQE